MVGVQIIQPGPDRDLPRQVRKERLHGQFRRLRHIPVPKDREEDLQGDHAEIFMRKTDLAALQLLSEGFDERRGTVEQGAEDLLPCKGLQLDDRRLHLALLRKDPVKGVFECRKFAAALVRSDIFRQNVLHGVIAYTRQYVGEKNAENEGDQQDLDHDRERCVMSPVIDRDRQVDTVNEVPVGGCAGKARASFVRGPGTVLPENVAGSVGQPESGHAGRRGGVEPCLHHARREEDVHLSLVAAALDIPERRLIQNIRRIFENDGREGYGLRRGGSEEVLDIIPVDLPVAFQIIHDTAVVVKHGAVIKLERKGFGAAAHTGHIKTAYDLGARFPVRALPVQHIEVKGMDPAVVLHDVRHFGRGIIKPRKLGGRSVERDLRAGFVARVRRFPHQRQENERKKDRCQKARKNGRNEKPRKKAGSIIGERPVFHNSNGLSRFRRKLLSASYHRTGDRERKRREPGPSPFLLHAVINGCGHRPTDSTCTSRSCRAVRASWCTLPSLCRRQARR